MKQFKRSSKILSTLLACTMILSSVQLFSMPVQATVDTIKVDKSKTFQEIWGFGAAANNPVNDLMVGPYIQMRTPGTGIQTSIKSSLLVNQLNVIQVCSSMLYLGALLTG